MSRTTTSALAPLPWRLLGVGRHGQTTIVSADGRVVARCSRTPWGAPTAEEVANAAVLVDAVNEEWFRSRFEGG